MGLRSLFLYIWRAITSPTIGCLDFDTTMEVGQDDTAFVSDGEAVRPLVAPFAKMVFFFDGDSLLFC